MPFLETVYQGFHLNIVYLHSREPERLLIDPLC